MKMLKVGLDISKRLKYIYINPKRKEYRHSPKTQFLMKIRQYEWI